MAARASRPRARRTDLLLVFLPRSQQLQPRLGFLGCLDLLVCRGVVLVLRHQLEVSRDIPLLRDRLVPREVRDALLRKFDCLVPLRHNIQPLQEALRFRVLR